jgi:hypothetical protein
VSLVWYAAYGSNMAEARFLCYLRGGRPEGAVRTYPGARDHGAPRDSAALWLDGGVYFATRSLVWGGGRALYDPLMPRKAAARAWLITAGQLSDVAAQEMGREPGADLDLAPLLSSPAGRLKAGEGHYETLVLAGRRGGIPVVTFTAPWRCGQAGAPPLTPPSAAYLTVLGRGLRESRGWNAEAAGRYLAGLPGASEKWRWAQIAKLLDGYPESGGRPQRARTAVLVQLKRRPVGGGSGTMAIFCLLPEMMAELQKLQDDFPDLDFETFRVGGALQVVARNRRRGALVVADSSAQLREKLAEDALSDLDAP